MDEIDLRVDESCEVNVACEIYENYKISMGSESFYKLMGDNTLYGLNKLIYEDDRSKFESLVKEAQIGNKIVVRLLVRNNKYRWVVMRLVAANAGFEHTTYKLMISDIIDENEKYLDQDFEIRKYKLYMDLSDEKLFKYDFESHIFTIYYYAYGRVEVLEKSKLEIFENNVISNAYLAPDEEENFHKLISDIRSGLDSFSSTITNSVLSKGEWCETQVFRGRTMYEAGEKKLVIGTIISRNSVQKNEKLLFNEEVDMDAFTGILNKKAATEDIKAEIFKAKQEGNMKPKYLMIIDIDNFKSVNDSYGHHFGDEVILALATELKRSIGNKGITGRIGGDEFICLLNDYESIEEVRNFLKTFRKKLKSAFAKEKPNYEFSVSIGVSEFPKDANSYDSLFKIADSCLYIAKEKGKDRYIIYVKEIHGDLIDDNTKNSKTYLTGDFMKSFDKAAMMVDMLKKLDNSGLDDLRLVIEEFLDRMNIHGMLICNERNKKNIRAFGHYPKDDFKLETLFDEDYLKIFDEYGCNSINNINSLALDYPTVYKTMKDMNICSSYQILMGEKGRRYLICFDIFGEYKRKWNKSDEICIYTFMNIIHFMFNLDDI